MAIYGNMTWNVDSKHWVAESSNLKSTIVGNIYDLIVKDTQGEIAVDNGTAVVVGDYTGDGLQTRYATVAEDKSKIALVLSVPTVKDGYSKTSEQPYNFYNKAGAVARAYEVVEEDIFGVSKEAIDATATTNAIAVGDYVVWNGTKYATASADPTATNGFVAKVHSIQTGTFYDLVRLFVVQNKEIA